MRVPTTGVTAVAIAVCAVAGCSSNDSDKSSSSSASGSAAASAGTTVLVDGQKQDVTGTVVCTAADANTNVTIGDSTAGVGAVLSNDSPPAVHSVGLGSVSGVMLGYADGAGGQGAASASKTGNSYKITGTAVGFDASTQQQLTKPFELDFTCP
ncbi:lipoprotein LpqH [Mycobacterium crocinum]|uniref:Lipoprotein LpqH n=1 Tax=Mycolicibacterium crocinum TaxID=388459 RepID=A0ABY3THL8_9MYCO|nr:lipoprotein LpqH [Mycolicibacterium crocinum]MCV7213684.1 lipoprotein LpqH [Mycolicibacterium crocinum]ULN39239.1 lipoprotein LpqH [Mycolicibacterium crocinum]